MFAISATANQLIVFWKSFYGPRLLMANHTAHGALQYMYLLQVTITRCIEAEPESSERWSDIAMQVRATLSGTRAGPWGKKRKYRARDKRQSVALLQYLSGWKRHQVNMIWANYYPWATGRTQNPLNSMSWRRIQALLWAWIDLDHHTHPCKLIPRKYTFYAKCRLDSCPLPLDWLDVNLPSYVCNFTLTTMVFTLDLNFTGLCFARLKRRPPDCSFARKKN